MQTSWERNKCDCTVVNVTVTSIPKAYEQCIMTLQDSFYLNTYFRNFQQICAPSILQIKHNANELTAKTNFN